MQHANTRPDTLAAPAVSEDFAGAAGGVVAGIAYLVAQVTFTAAARAGSASEPLQRIAAILMGPNTAPPPADFNFTVFGMALIIHLGLSVAFGRIVAALIWNRPLGTGVVLGALAGLALYAVNFGWIAPAAFPWFADTIRWATVLDHAVFGAIAAAVALTLRHRRA